MLRVVHVSSVHPADDTRILHKEACAVVASGGRAALIARGNPAEPPDGVDFVAIHAPRWRPARVALAPWVALGTALRQRATLYHLHDPELLLAGVFLKWLTRALIVLDVHENIPAQIQTKGWIPSALRKPAATLYRVVERTLLPLYDAVVLAEDSYLPLYARHPRVRIIHNYPLEVPAPPASRGAGARVRVVYVGGISGVRGAMTMLEAAALLQERGLTLRWTLIGQTDSRSLAEEMQRYIRDHNLEDTVELRGRLPFHQAQAEVARSDIGVCVLAAIPNYVGSLPTKLLEYMMAGLPVVASDFPLWKSLVDRFGCGMTVRALDAQELANAVEKLSRDPGLRESMGQRGRRGLLDHGMTWAEEARRLCALYEEIARP